jgi:rod shape-determining protein MreC
MLDTQLRQRPLALLVIVVLAQVLLLAFQIKRERDVPLIRYWADELVTPAGRAGTWTSSKFRGIWTGYIALRGAHAENERLRGELDQLRLRTRDLESQAGEAQRLRALLDFREAHSEVPMLAAQVIGASADPTSHILFINRGERDRLRRNMAVITPDGIVGKVVEVFANNTAQVLLINDKESGVGVLFADTRTHGVVKGTGDPEPVMDYVSNDEKVHAGQIIVTSGEDRIFPKDLPVGVVEGTKPGITFQVIRVRPAVHLDRLEDVLILLSRQDATLKAIQESPAAAASQIQAPSPPPAPEQ